MVARVGVSLRLAQRLGNQLTLTLTVSVGIYWSKYILFRIFAKKYYIYCRKTVLIIFKRDFLRYVVRVQAYNYTNCFLICTIKVVRLCRY